MFFILLFNFVQFGLIRAPRTSVRKCSKSSEPSIISEAFVEGSVTLIIHKNIASHWRGIGSARIRMYDKYYISLAKRGRRSFANLDFSLNFARGSCVGAFDLHSLVLVPYFWKFNEKYTKHSCKSFQSIALFGGHEQKYIFENTLLLICR